LEVSLADELISQRPFERAVQHRSHEKAVL
jgi:hypothetical protein